MPLAWYLEGGSHHRTFSNPSCSLDIRTLLALTAGALLSKMQYRRTIWHRLLWQKPLRFPHAGSIPLVQAKRPTSYTQHSRMWLLYLERVGMLYQYRHCDTYWNTSSVSLRLCHQIHISSPARRYIPTCMMLMCLRVAEGPSPGYYNRKSSWNSATKLLFKNSIKHKERVMMVSKCTGGFGLNESGINMSGDIYWKELRAPLSRQECMGMLVYY
jgi:hypothetical protein